MIEEEDLEKTIEDLLLQKIHFSLLPREENGWNLLRISHEAPSKKKFERNFRDKIRKEIGNRNGLYVYQDSKTHLPLYVGEGNIARRIESHYKESYLEPGNSKWIAFFNEHRVKMDVYWVELEIDKSIRRFVERMLEKNLNPKFICYKFRRRKTTALTARTKAK
jgi:hypothetical protein